MKSAMLFLYPFNPSVKKKYFQLLFPPWNAEMNVFTCKDPVKYYGIKLRGQKKKPFRDLGSSLCKSRLMFWDLV